MCFQEPETTSHFWKCHALDKQRKPLITCLKQQWIKTIDNILNKQLKPLITTETINTIFDTTTTKYLLQGIITNTFIQQHKNLGICKEETNKIARTLGKQGAKLSYENTWKNRCKTQINWKKENNITQEKKHKQNAVQTKTKNNPTINKQKRKQHQPSLSSIVIHNGHTCICGIPTQLHYPFQCNEQNYNNFLADEFTNQEYIGEKWGNKMVSINM